MAQHNDAPVEAGDDVKLNYGGPGPDPHFTVGSVEADYHIHLSNGATVYPKDFDADRMEVVN